MMQSGWFSICTIDDILKVTGAVPAREDYNALRLLHCVSFMDFPPRLRLEFPQLLERVLSSPSMDLNITFKPLARPPALLEATR